MPQLSALTSYQSIYVFIAIVVTIAALYFSRGPAHAAIRSLTRVIHSAMRLGAASLFHAEQKLAARNREVLLAAGREAAEQKIEREFDRMDKSVQRDLAECPTLQRRMNEQIARIEEDHQRSTDVPPSPPGWTNAVEAVANIPSKGDPMVANILDKIHESLVEAQNKARDAYRAVSKERHENLKKMRPNWRALQHSVDQMDKNVRSLLGRAKTIDRYVEDYEEIQKGSDRAIRNLHSSSLTNFFVSGLFCAIAIGGAFINFHLIARPMSEMVGGSNAIGAFRIADIAAMVIILVEISMGLFLMESLRFTRLFPVIGALPDKMRVRMLWFAFGLLLCLATIEAGLAFMREILMHDELATSAALRGQTSQVVFASDFLWITTVAQMGMGFILPFALTFVAIPLESFVAATRTVLGLMLQGFLKALAVCLRVLGSVIYQLGNVLVEIYDLIVFLPLWLERMIKANGGSARKGSKTATAREVF